MSVLLVLTTVTLMLPVPTLLVTSPVPVTQDTLEMESHVAVYVSNGYHSSFSIPAKTLAPELIVRAWLRLG
jgi:hypothetical protein